MTIRIENRIGVAAPAGVVWPLIYDVAAWKDWSGLYTEVTGRIAIGETVTFTYRLGGRGPESVPGVIYDWVPEAQLAWQSKLPLRVRSLRYVEIEALTETSCILANGEYLTGLGTRFIPPARRSETRAGFETMNLNAKRIAEARWADEGGEIVPAPPEPSNEDFAIRPLMQPTGLQGKPWGFGAGRNLLGPTLKR